MKPALSTIIVATGLALGLAGPVAAESAHETEPGLATSGGEAKVTSRIADTFADFAGSQANAASLVNGLRTGGEITLTGGTGTGTNTSADSGGRVAASKGGTAPATATFAPPTGTMGYGGVYASLALAQAQLASYGIDNPTPQQIAAALNGGTVTSGTGESVALEGILQMRADGMGWGEIARAQGTKLGSVVSGMKHASGGASHRHHSGSEGSGRGIHNALGGNAAAGHAYGWSKSQSVVAATGASAGAAVAAAGIVTGTGASPAAPAAGAGIVTAASAGGGAAGAGAAAIVTPAGGVGSIAATGATSAVGSGGGIVSAAGGTNGHAHGQGHRHGRGHAYAYGRGKHGR